MTRYDDRQLVRGAGVCYGAHGFRLTDGVCNVRVGLRLARRDSLQHLPNALLKSSARMSSEDAFPTAAGPRVTLSSAAVQPLNPASSRVKFAGNYSDLSAPFGRLTGQKLPRHKGPALLATSSIFAQFALERW